MTNLNEQCWGVIGALGSKDGGAFSDAAVTRLIKLGLVETAVDGAPRLTADGDYAYVVLESGDDFPGLE